MNKTRTRSITVAPPSPEWRRDSNGARCFRAEGLLYVTLCNFLVIFLAGVFHQLPIRFEVEDALIAPRLGVRRILGVIAPVRRDHLIGAESLENDGYTLGGLKNLY